MTRNISAEFVPTKHNENDKNIAPEWVYGDLLNTESLARACHETWGIVHCAGHAHAFGQPQESARNEHRRINQEGTQNLLLAAGRSGVKRFVFLSSVKAMRTPGGHCADESWPEMPNTAYGQAKLAAEKAILQTAARYDFQATNLRLAMVYGEGGGGNLLRMAKAIAAGRFPPLPETGHRRSLIHIDDVVRAVRTAIESEQTKRDTYIIAHHEALSGARIYDLLRNALELSPARLRCPLTLLQLAGWAGNLAAHFMRRPPFIDSSTIERLVGGEHYNPSAFEDDTGWRAYVDHEEGLSRWIHELKLNKLL